MCPHGRGPNLVSGTAMDESELVTAAAALLDDVRPGWARRVDLRQVEMNSARTCVLSQVFWREGQEYRFTQIDLDNGYDYAMKIHDRRLELQALIQAFIVPADPLWVEAVQAR